MSMRADFKEAEMEKRVLEKIVKLARSVGLKVEENPKEDFWNSMQGRYDNGGWR